MIWAGCSKTVPNAVRGGRGRVGVRGDAGGVRRRFIDTQFPMPSSEFFVKLRQVLILALDFSSGPLTNFKGAFHKIPCSHYEILQRLLVSSASKSPAPPSLQRLSVSSASLVSSASPVSSASHSPAPPLLQRLPFSSARRSPAPNIHRRLPFSSANHSPIC
jgi:hypothetical protein